MKSSGSIFSLNRGLRHRRDVRAVHLCCPQSA
jgi:hypothetical protein